MSRMRLRAVLPRPTERLLDRRARASVDRCVPVTASARLDAM